jgi:hypothetical protein
MLGTGASGHTDTAGEVNYKDIVPICKVYLIITYIVFPSLVRGHHR